MVLAVMLPSVVIVLRDLCSMWLLLNYYRAGQVFSKLDAYLDIFCDIQLPAGWGDGFFCYMVTASCVIAVMLPIVVIIFVLGPQNN